MAKNKPKKTKVRGGPVGREKYILRLFVAGISPNSTRAIINIEAICKKHLKDRYELEIIDIYQLPELAISEEIIAIPILIKQFPLPEEKFIGDMSDTEKVLKGLNLNDDNESRGK